MATFGMVLLQGLVLGLLFGFQGIARQLHEPDALTSPKFIFLDTELTCLSVMLLLAAIRGFSVPLIRARYGLSWPRISPGTFAVAVAGTLTLAIGTVPLSTVLKERHWLPSIMPPSYFRELYESLRHARVSTRVILALATGIFPGLSEELMFRGHVQRGLLANWPPFPSIVVTSVMFALWHVEPVRFLTTFSFGCLIGWIAWRCNSIVPGMGLHAINNSVFGLAGVLAGAMIPITEERHTKFPETGLLVLSLVGLALAAVCVYFLARRLPRAPGSVTDADRGLSSPHGPSGP